MVYKLALPHSEFSFCSQGERDGRRMGLGGGYSGFEGLVFRSKESTNDDVLLQSSELRAHVRTYTTIFGSI